MDTGIVMMSGWSTVWDIAGKRHETKRGKGHLSDHAFEVLQYNVAKEQQDAMAAAMGIAMGKLGFLPRRSE